MTVIVTNKVLKLGGEDIAKARDTAPRIPQTDINIISWIFHTTPPMRQNVLKINTFMMRPTKVAIIAANPSFQ